jgi:GTP-binding protein
MPGGENTYLTYQTHLTHLALRIDVTFVRSAAAAADFPRDGAPEVALVGRSNVGKSTLINALVGRRVARTSADPGKTRLANIYRVERDGTGPLYLVDLPGYGYARGGSAGFDELAREYFSRPSVARGVGALLLVDARHRGLESDVAAWRWLCEAADDAAIAATKIDKLARGERIRATRELESVFEHPVAPVSARTGEGLDELWKVIDRLANSNSSRQQRSRNPRKPATAPRRP